MKWSALPAELRLLVISWGFALQQLTGECSSLADETTTSRLQFKQRSIDAGRVLQGEVVQREFSFVNSGKSALHIKNVEAGCSCSIADYSRDAIPAAASGTIKVGIKTAGKRGPFRGTFRVTCSAGSTEWKEDLEVTVVVTADGKIAADPGSIYLGEVVPGASIKRTVTLSVPDHSDRPIQISSVRGPDWLKTQVESGEKPETWSLHLSGKIPDASGELLDVLTIENTSMAFPTVEVAIVGFINGSIRLQPRSVLKVVSSNNPSPECSVKITDRRQEAVQVESIQLSGIEKANLTVSTAPPSQGEATSIILRPTFTSPSQRVIKGAVLVTIRVPAGKPETVRLPVLFVQPQSNVDQHANSITPQK